MYVFEVDDYGISDRFHEFKMTDPIWLPCFYKISMKLLKKSLSPYIADYKSEVRKSKFKMTDPTGLPCCYEISIKLVVVLIHFYSCKNGRNNRKERWNKFKKKKSNVKKWRSG